MDFNPLTRICTEIQTQIEELQRNENKVADELQSYSSIDPGALTDDLRRNEAQAEQLQVENQGLEKEIQENATRLSEIESAVGILTRKSTEVKRQIDGLQESKKQVADELLWYSSIDPLSLAQDLREKEATAKNLLSEILTLEERIRVNAARLDEIEPAIGTLFNPLNWFAKDQLDLRRRHTELREIGYGADAQRQSNVKGLEDTRARIAKVKSDLERHSTFDFPRRQSDVHQITQTIAGKQEDLAIVADRIRRDSGMATQLREIGNQKTAQRQSNVKELEDTRRRMANVTGDLQRHRTFDVARRQSDLSQIKKNIAAKKDELARAAERKRQVDEVLAPLIQEIQNLESRKRAKSELDAAQDFHRRLSSAGSPKERRMIHEECERRFGEGSPYRIIGEVQQLERDLEKAKRRVEEIVRQAARKIDTIVIDGNNLCYESGNTFIGLSALEALVPLLARISFVIVVFDSAIRNMLKTDNSGIQSRLGSHAKVHIVASKSLADETVLELACANELNYVLSNDRFGEFKEKSVVKEGRIIQHEIVNGNVFVHDLQLRASYLPENGELRG